MAVIGHNNWERTAAAANDAARRFLRLIAERSSGAPSPRFIRILEARAQGFSLGAAPAIEFALAAAIGVAAVLVFFALFAPLPTPASLPDAPPQRVAAEMTPATVGNPFRTAAIGAAPAAVEAALDLAETTLDLALHGVWVDENGGSAIIETPDGEQGRYFSGDEIWNGAVLDRVLIDQVIINSAGVREALRLVNREPSAPKPAPGQATLAPAAAGFGDVVRIVPRASADGLRLTLQPGRNSKRFAELGLRAGDILVAVDNRRIGPEFAAEAQRLRDMGAKSVIPIVIERDGVNVPIEINLTTEGNSGPDDD